MFYEVTTPNKKFSGERYGVQFFNGLAHVADDWMITRASREQPVAGAPLRVIDLLREDLGYTVTELPAGATPLPRPRGDPA